MVNLVFANHQDTTSFDSGEVPSPPLSPAETDGPSGATVISNMVTVELDSFIDEVEEMKKGGDLSSQPPEDSKRYELNEDMTYSTFKGTRQTGLGACQPEQATSQTGYETSPTGYGASPTGYGASQTGYGASPIGYGASQAGYGSSQTGYGYRTSPMGQWSSLSQPSLGSNVNKNGLFVSEML